MEGREVEEPESFRELRLWAEQRGVTWRKVRYPVRFEPGYIGAQAKEAIGPNEDIIVVPCELILDSRVARASLGEIFDAHPEVFATDALESEDLTIIAFIIQELHKGRDSFWFYILNALPRDAENLCDWTPAEVSELRDATLEHQLALRKQAVRNNWKALKSVLKRYPAVFPAEDVTYANFYWIWQNLTTRAFGKYAPSSAFAPIADSLNHDYSHTYYVIGPPGEKMPYMPSLVCLDSEIEIADHFELSYLALARISYSGQRNPGKKLALLMKAKERDEWNKRETKDEWGGPFTALHSQYFRMTTGGDEMYEEGSQLFLFYGQYSNRQLLLYYGFTLSKNWYNYAVVTYKIAELMRNPQAEEKVPEELRQKKMFFTIREKLIAKEFLDILRMLWWDPDQHSANSFFCPDDLNLELEIVTAAQQLLRTELEKDPTPLAAERDLLASARSARHYFAVCFTQISYRISVKESLIGQIDLLTVVRGILEERLQGRDNFEVMKTVQTVGNTNLGEVPQKTALREYLSALK